jgi:hypothetical protein
MPSRCITTKLASIAEGIGLVLELPDEIGGLLLVAGPHSLHPNRRSCQSIEKGHGLRAAFACSRQQKSIRFGHDCVRRDEPRPLRCCLVEELSRVGVAAILSNEATRVDEDAPNAAYAAARGAYLSVDTSVASA